MDAACFQDESKYEGGADALFVPETVEELTAYVKSSKEQGQTITVQGGLTGITGSGVPVSGCAVSMQKLNKVTVLEQDGIYYAKAQAGTTAEQLEKVVRQETRGRMFLPVLPTEKTATLGGIAACGARGIYAWHYGELQDYVTELCLCNAQGELQTYTRDMPEFKELFRSEGMYGILISFDIRLVEKPSNIWGIMFQFESDSAACAFSGQIEARPGLLVIEYMDRKTTDLIEMHKKGMNSIAALLDLEKKTNALIYVELAGSTQEDAAEGAECLLEACMEVGGDPDLAWAMCTEEEIDRLRAFRHAASECVNMEIGAANGMDKRIRKLSVDICPLAPDRISLLEGYRKELQESGLQYCIFGHFGKCSPYVNIIAENYMQYKKGTELIKRWIKNAYKEHAQVFQEHGVGKMKKELFCELAPVDVVSHAIRQKEKWDRDAFFNPGNMF